MAKSHLQKALKAEPAGVADGRQAARHKYVQFLWFQAIDGERESGALGRSLDVSDGGIGFISTHTIKMDSRLFLVLLTPFGRISSIARVVHCNAAGRAGFRIGVRLEIIPPSDMMAWKTLVGKEAR